MKAQTRTVWQWVVGLFFIPAGVNHFLNPNPYVTMMPAWLPAHVALVQISGVAEILGGVGVLIPQTRRCAAWGLIALLVAVFPANLNVALHGWPGENIPAWILWARLPFQPLMIWWIWRIYLID
jgi:uncharacterized membrane protein